jgi:hypothetical protein
VSQQLVPLSRVLRSGDYAQVVSHVQTAHDVALKRNDVINVVRDSSSACQARRLFVETANRLLIGPWWHRPELRRDSFGVDRVHDIPIGVRPLLISAGQVGLVFLAKSHIVSFAVLRVAVAPVLKHVRVLLSVLVKSCLRAVAACEAETIVRRGAFVEGAEWLRDLANVTGLPAAGLQLQGASFTVPSALSLDRATALADCHDSESVSWGPKASRAIGFMKGGEWLRQTARCARFGVGHVACRDTSHRTTCGVSHAA